MNDALLDGVLPGGWIGVTQIFAALVCLASFSGLAALSRHPALTERICGKCCEELDSTAPSPAAGASSANNNGEDDEKQGRSLGAVLQIVAVVVTANLFNMTNLAALYPGVVKNIPGYDIREPHAGPSGHSDFGQGLVAVMQLFDLLGRLSPRF